MSDPSTLLLLTCATCLGNTSTQLALSATTDASCVRSTGEIESDRSVAPSNNCVSPPEVIASVPASSLVQESAVSESATLAIALGSKGEAVTRLQTKLQQLGYYNGALDGQYGSLTAAAVSKFQQSKGLSTDGVAGSLTLAKLAASSPEPSRAAGESGSRKSSTFVSAPEQSATPESQERSPTPQQAVQLASLAGKAPLQANLSLGSLAALPQSVWLLGGAVLLTGGFGFLLLLKPFSNERLNLARLKLEGISDDLSPDRFPYDWGTPTENENASEKSVTRRWKPPTESVEFDQSVVLQQSRIWLQLIVWGIVGVTGFVIIWASVAKVEEVIPAQGKLEPQGTVNDVQVPVSGVVKDIYVKEGQRVKPGDVLLVFDQTAARAQLKSLQSVRAALVQENEVYRRQLQGDTSPAAIKIPDNLAMLTKNRAALLAENQLYQQQLQGGNLDNLSPEQRQRLQSALSEVNSRVAAAELAVSQLEKQLGQNEIALANTRRNLSLNQDILDRFEWLSKEGAIAKLQVLTQQQEANNLQAEVARLTQERGRLQLEIAQSKEQVQNTRSASRQDLFVKIDNNKKGIADIDSQLSKAIVENEKSMAEIDSQLSQTQQTLRYQDLRATVAGTIFDLKATRPGFVASNSEPILKIVPHEGLVAKVFVTNQHIGFIKPGMQVDVRTDTFPFSEYGDIKGELVTIGSDALPPDSTYPFYRFPAKIRLQRQTIDINGRETQLQSGMTVSANIKVRKRTVMSIFTSLFTQKLDALKSVR